MLSAGAVPFALEGAALLRRDRGALLAAGAVARGRLTRGLAGPWNVPRAAASEARCGRAGHAMSRTRVLQKSYHRHH